MEHATAAAPAVLLWLQDGAVGRAMRQSVALYPAVEILHILGFSLLIGAIAALDLRLLFGGRTLPVAPLARLLLPVAIGGFLLAVPMGVLLFASDAVAIAGNPAFRLKLLLIAAALVNVAVLHRGAWRRVAAWGDRTPPAARIAAALSILFWFGTAACGRLIAYL